MSAVFRHIKPQENPSESSRGLPKSKVFSMAKELPAEEQEESLQHNIGRQVLRSGARAAESVLGAPRAIGEFAESLVPEKALIKGAEKIGLGEGAKSLLETTKKFAPYKLFPKSEDIRENITKPLFGLEPKNKWEEKADELVSDFASLSIPLPGAQLKILKPFVVATGANLVKEGLGAIGASESTKTYGKLGTMLLGTMVNPKGADKLKNDLYAQARANRPANAKVSAQNIRPEIHQFRTDLHKGGTAASKVQSLKKLDEIENVIKNGEIEIEELEKFKIAINEARAGLYEEFKSNKPGMKLARSNLDKVSKIVDNGLKEYGRKNPSWEAFYRPANEAHGAIENSKKVRNLIKRYYKTAGTSGALALFGIEQAFGPLHSVGAASAGTGALLTGELMARVWKSPVLRKYYLNVLKEASRDNIPAMTQNLMKLDKELKSSQQ
jgi:hypothetical protein